ncbi:MAG: VanZ family protein, partial [bacterium]|nr:VanZ family protein [bacterium]
MLSRFWLPVFIWAAIIFSFSHTQTIKTSQFFWQDFFLKKTAHFTEYFVFFVLVYRGFRNTTAFSKVKTGL